MVEHGNAQFTLQRVISLETENFDLKKQLESFHQDYRKLEEKYNKLSKEFSTMKDFVYRQGRKMIKFASKPNTTITGFLSTPISPLKNEDVVLEFPDKLFSHADGKMVDEVVVTIEDELFPNEDLPEEQFEMETVDQIMEDGKIPAIKETLDEIMEDGKIPSIKETDESDSVEPLQLTSAKHICPSFEQMNLKEELLHGIHAYGAEKFCKFEINCIISNLFTSQNALVEVQCRNTGVCKIATYCIFILQQVNTFEDNCQALIIVPYRDLAQKILKVLETLGKYMNVQFHACIGRGTKIKQEKMALSNGVHVIVGTPGRIYDMILHKSLSTENISYLVLDEAHELSSDKFMNQTGRIIYRLPKEKQIILFTSHMTPELGEFCAEFMQNGQITLQMKRSKPTLDAINQFYVNLDANQLKARALLELRKHFRKSRMVIYCNSPRKVGFLRQLFVNRKEPVFSVHSSMKQASRHNIMKAFMSRSTKTLITTDLPIGRLEKDSRLENVSVLINYELPPTPENYFSRILQCGKQFSKGGTVINLIVPRDPSQRLTLKGIEDFYNTDIIEVTLKDERTNECAVI